MLALLVLLAWRGARRGLVLELGGLFAFVLAFALAVRFTDVVGVWLHKAASSLSVTEAQIVAFLVILLLAFAAVGVVTHLLSGVIRRVPLAAGANRLGGLLVGAALALLVIWLLTTALLCVPASLVPSLAGVQHSATAQLVRGLPAGWGRELRAQLPYVGAAWLR